ncbi:MAG: type II toxin-antitoxin system VapC family toxin [Atopobiaceae bacterium]|nr:type II toxin-antitoxin system VapC family toxin [Atopobiaceae bacterium]
MNLLLDTHFVLWFAKGDNRLPVKLRQEIEDPSNSVFASEISVLEIAIKHAKNPSAMPYSGSDFVALCSEGQINLRPLTLEAILAYGELSFDKVGDLHKDPFDRLLITQAKTESLTFATHDRLLALYGEPVVSVYT